MLPSGCKTPCSDNARPLHRINGFTHLNLTKLDVLSKLETIRLGTGYMHNGQVGPDHCRAVPACTAQACPLKEDVAWLSRMSEVGHHM